MMSQEFLAAVLPSAGSYCAMGYPADEKPKHFFADTPQAVYEKAMEFSQAGYDAYFALASFGDKKRRLAENATMMRSMFLDIDCNGVNGEKEYTSKAEGAAALDQFLVDSGLDALGSPYLVNSGGGIHVYWPLSEDAPIKEWKRVAENLKKVCRKFGFKIDYSVPADAARVLRVPDSFNYKKEKPRRVKLMVTGEPETFALADIDAILLNHLGEEAVPEESPLLDLPGQRPKALPNPNGVKLVENTISLFKNIDEATKAGKGCGQLAYYKEHASDDGMEPLWYALISLAKRCDDGYAHAKALGEMHPYDEARLNDKWNHTKGPMPCIKFDSINPGVCDKCPSFGKITNPLHFSREIQTTTEELELVVEHLEEDDTISTRTFKAPPPPKGFSYGKTGGVYVDKVLEDADGTKSKKPVLILSYDLFVVDILLSEGEHLVHMVAVRNGRSADVVFPQKAVISKDETLKALASQNIIAAFGAGNDKNLFEYVRACVEQASVNKQAVQVPTSYGWQPDESFVYGGKIYYANGGEISIPMPGLANLNNFCKQAGTIERWRGAFDMVIAKELWGILAMGMIGPASLLMEFTGFSGMTYHMGSTESGTGKSLAQLMAASFFAHPIKYRVTQSTSAVAIQQRAGMLRNFAVITDEITSKSRKDFEWLPEYLLDKSQGKGKDRMENGANKERINTTEWNNMDLFSSNTHVLDYLSGARKHASQAEILRVLELELTKPLELSDTDTDNIEALKTNYGVAGVQFIRWLVQNKQVAISVLNKVRAKLKEEFRATSDERYWTAGNSCIVAASILLGDKYAGILNVPIKPIIEELHGLVNAARAALRGSKRSAEDILNAYTRENYGKFIVVKSVDGITQATLGGDGVIDQSITRTQVAGRVEHGVTPNRIDYFIEESQLKHHCASMSFGYSDLIDRLSALPQYSVRFTKKNMLAKTRGPEMRMQTVCISRPIDADEES